MSPEPVSVQLGPVEAFIEPASGQLRYLRLGKHELMRGIYAAVRQSDWGTVVPVITDFKVRSDVRQFECTFKATNRAKEIDFAWEGRVSGRQTSETRVEIEYEFSGLALSDFMTCRTGVCVLHPRAQRGKKVEVEHHQSECETGAFPVLIKPDSPFKDIKAVTVDIDPGISIRTEFHGEVFEMEDQRNWSDASYKTYCRPQEWGSPYTVKEGQKIDHRIKMVIDFTGAVEEAKPSQTSGVIPNLGTVVNRAWNQAEADTVKQLGLRHLQTNATGIESAKKAGLPLFYQTSTPAVPVELSPSDAIVLHPPQSWHKLNEVRGARHFAASLGNFVDINRCRPVFDEVEGIVFSMNPQVHAFDTQTIMECPWTFADSVQTARGFGAKSVVAGPLLLKQGGADERIQGIEVALYTLNAIAHLAKAKADYATFFDAGVLANSPAALPLQLIAGWKSREVEVWELEPWFIMIRGEQTILANLSWLSSEHFKQTPLDLEENLKVGIKGSYRLFTADNIARWREVLASPPSHNILGEMPPYSIVVLG
jgi:hypothetical protein